MVIFVAVLGLIFGSFANAVIWRLHEQDKVAGHKRKRSDTRNLSIMKGRSICTHCGHGLAARDLVPVLSYFWLRGKCRYCGKPIEDTPLAELLTLSLFVISYIWWPVPLHVAAGATLFALWLGILTCFVILALYDLRWFLLPDRVVYPLIGLSALSVLARAAWLGGGVAAVAGAAMGVLMVAGLFYGIYIASRRKWIGFGDVKLGIALGLLAGGLLPALALIFIASLLGSVVAIPLLLRGRAKPTTAMPFGPFLLAAGVVVVLFSAPITAWYLRLLVA